MEDVAPKLHRSESEVREWIRNELQVERSCLEATTAKNTVGAGMSMGAREVLQRLEGFLDGDEEA